MLKITVSLLIFAGFLSCPALCQSEFPAVFENPKLTGENKTLPHSYFIPFADIESAKTLRNEESPFYFSLNGQWKFNWVDNPAQRPVDFFKTDYSDLQWDDILYPCQLGNERLWLPNLCKPALRMDV